MWHVHVYTSLSLKCKILSHTHGKKSRYRSARLPSCLWSARAQLSCVRAQPSPRAGSVCSRYTLYVVRRLLRRERMPVRLPATEAGRRATPVLCPHTGGWQAHGHALGAGGARHHRASYRRRMGVAIAGWRRSPRLRPLLPRIPLAPAPPLVHHQQGLPPPPPPLLERALQASRG